MRAAFLDPQLQTIPYIAPLVIFGLNALIASWIPAGAELPLLFLTVIAYLVVDLLPWRQQRSRQVEIARGSGFVDIKRAGFRWMRIHAKSIAGATTARTSRGVLLTLSVNGRDEPMSIEVEHDADADQIRQALGIGHGGFGTVGFRTAPATKWTKGARAIVFVFLVYLALHMLLVGDVRATDVASSVPGFGILVLVILGLVGRTMSNGPPNIAMTAEGLRILTRLGTYNIPYASVRDIERSKGCVTVFTTLPNLPRVDVPAAGTWRGLSDEAMHNFKAQVTSAVGRAHGMGPQKEDIRARIDILRRRSESPRDWLSRLDTVGHMLSTSGSGGYRSQSIDTADLWTVLEDPDADVEIRTAATRVLRHSREPDARVRIEHAVSAVHDKKATNQLRIAMEEDLEVASDELAEIDLSGPIRHG